jgi:hypothetical protein
MREDKSEHSPNVGIRIKEKTADILLVVNNTAHINLKSDE